jgi:hypothetical protein
LMFARKPLFVLTFVRSRTIAASDMKTCHACLISAPDSEQICPKCGRQMYPVVESQATHDDKGKSSVISGAGIAAVAFGGISLFLPFFAAVFLIPVALVCSLIALKNRSNGLGVVGLIISGIGVLALFSQSFSLAPSSSATHNVIYTVSGSALRASVTVENESGGTEQHTISLPWTKEFQAKDGQFVYLSAQNQGFGSLEAVIYVDGQPLQRAETTEQYGIASARGSVH